MAEQCDFLFISSQTTRQNYVVKCVATRCCSNAVSIATYLMDETSCGMNEPSRAAIGWWMTMIWINSRGCLAGAPKSATLCPWQIPTTSYSHMHVTTNSTRSIHGPLVKDCITLVNTRYYLLFLCSLFVQRKSNSLDCLSWSVDVTSIHGNLARRNCT